MLRVVRQARGGQYAMVGVASGAQDERRRARVQIFELVAPPPNSKGRSWRREDRPTAMEEDDKLQSETVTTLRTLAHDLSNSIETIMQAAYLLAQVKLDDDNRRWLELIDKAAHDAARINREIREILRTHGRLP
jgi:signal transduction histidine kinase